ncbi:MAG: DUF1491 family protein [Alphaproteobacteria bacterium]
MSDGFRLQPRLKAGIWVKAWLRRTQVEGAFAAVVHKGDEDAGAVIIVINYLDGTAMALGQATQLDGSRGWRRLLGADPVPEREVSALIVRERSRDRDIWVVEVEDRQGRAFIDEVIL